MVDKIVKVLAIAPVDIHPAAVPSPSIIVTVPFGPVPVPTEPIILATVAVLTADVCALTNGNPKLVWTFAVVFAKLGNVIVRIPVIPNMDAANALLANAMSAGII
jgi:hypothetical protein